MIRPKLLLGVLCFLFSFHSIAQEGQESTISGQVSDMDGNTLSGVLITIKGTSQGVVSDIDGKYVLTANFSATDILIFKFVGMQTQEVVVGNKTTHDIVLQEDMLLLEDIVVVGYGEQEKKDITGAVGVIKSEELTARPNTQVGNLLQGKTAGVNVVASSGKPSQGLSIRIRGTNSINANSDPLYVVDGVPTTDTRALNPSDIENITVLKDAASAAIYGAQGANGVVIITTKAGRSEKPVLSFDTYTGVSQVWKTQKVLNGEQYRDLMTEMGQNTDWDKYSANTDWQNEVFQNGLTQNYQLSMSGKSNKTNYYVSGGYVTTKGAVRSAEMDRANFKVNIDQEVNKWIKVGSRISYTNYSDVDIKDNQSVNSGGVLLGTLTTPSVIGIYNEDGTFTSNPFQNWENPIASTDGSDRKYRNQRLLGNVYLEFSFLNNFSFKTNLGIDQGNGIYDYFLDPYRTSYGQALKGQGINNTDKSHYQIFENILKYNKEIKKHTIEVLGGAILQQYLWENNSIERRNFASDGIKTVNGGSEVVSATGTKSEKANMSYISRLNYAFDDRYLLTVNFRADGSSNFGPDNRWGYFPSLSGGWRISEERFLKGVDLITDLKVRAGWGIVGNDQIANYAYLGKIGSGANYPIGGVTQPGTYPASIENRSLKWEESEQTNIGLDVSVLNGRVGIIVDAYVKQTNDLLLNAPLPRTSGFDNAVQNVGALENRGLEFSLNTVNIDSEVKWNTNFNISFNRNEVKNLVGQELYVGNIAGRGEAIQVKEGQPLGNIYGYIFGGVDPQTGDAYYINQSGESTFEPTPEDRVIIGNANPDFFYGFTNTVEYKGLQLVVFLQGSKGADILNATRIDTEGMTDPKNQTAAVLNRWRKSGDVTNIPRASWGNTNNSRISDRFVEDASYLRVKTVTLSYNLPQNFIEKISMSNLRVFVTGENLYTFTNYSGFDPEVNAFGGNNTAFGIDYGTYPQTRSLIMGLSVKF